MSTASVIPISLDPSFDNLAEQDPSESGIFDLSLSDAHSSKVTKSLTGFGSVTVLGINRFRAIYSAIYRSKSRDRRTPVTVRMFPTPFGRQNVLYEKYWNLVSNLQEKAFSRMVVRRQTGASTLIALERVESERVSTYVRRNITLDNFLTLFSRISRVLSVLHASGFKHLDINPSNLLVGLKDRRVMLADVGVWVESPAKQKAYLISSERYIAPEVETGHRSPKNSFDIYSFGLTLIECVFVSRAHWQSFCISQADRLRRALEYVDLEADPIAGILSIGARCVERDPAKRPRSFDAILAEISKVPGKKEPMQDFVGDFIRRNGGMLPRIPRRRTRRVLRTHQLALGDVSHVHPIREIMNVVASVNHFLTRTLVSARKVRLGKTVKIGLGSTGLFLVCGFVVPSDLGYAYAALFFCATLLHEASRILAVKLS